jgi:hypothetical protein
VASGGGSVARDSRRRRGRCHRRHPGLAIKNPPNKTQKTRLKNPPQSVFLGFIGFFKN